MLYLIRPSAANGLWADDPAGNLIPSDVKTPSPQFVETGAFNGFILMPDLLKFTEVIPLQLMDAVSSPV